jgi:hypothetical protein
MNAMVRLDEEAQEAAPIAGVLTDQQSLFARHYVELGGNAQKAAELAGYAGGRYGYQLARLPHVQAAIRREQERLVQEGGTKGLKWMVGALDEPKLSGAVRFQCARWLAEAAGHGLAAQRAALGLPASEKPLAEMTLDELDAFITAGKAGITRLKEERAKTIEGEVVRSDARSDEGGEA